MRYLYTKRVQYKEYLFSTEDTDGLALAPRYQKHQDIISHSAEYASMLL